MMRMSLILLDSLSLWERVRERAYRRNYVPHPSPLPKGEGANPDARPRLPEQSIYETRRSEVLRLQPATLAWRSKPNRRFVASDSTPARCGEKAHAANAWPDCDRPIFRSLCSKPWFPDGARSIRFGAKKRP